MVWTGRLSLGPLTRNAGDRSDRSRELPARAAAGAATNRAPHGVMSIARRTAAPWVAAILLVTVLIGPATWQSPARATDPTVNEAITQQQQMQAELARQQTELADLQRQQSTLTASIRGLTSDIGSVGLEIAAAQRNLEQVSRDLEVARGVLWLIQQDIDSLAGNLKDMATSISTAQVDLAGREAVLQDHLRTAYEQSQTSGLEGL